MQDEPSSPSSSMHHAPAIQFTPITAFCTPSQRGTEPPCQSALARVAISP